MAQRRVSWWPRGGSGTVAGPRVIAGTIAVLAGMAPALAEDAQQQSAQTARRESPMKACGPLKGDSVAASSILAELMEGRDVRLQGRLIEGDLDADALWPAADGRPRTLRVVAGTLHLQDCRVAGRVAFPHSVFMGGFAMPCTEVRGEVDLSGSFLMDGLEAPRLTVVGRARLVDLAAGGDLNLDGATVRDRLELTGARVPGRLGLASARLHGGVDITTSILGSADLASARLSSSVALRDLLVLGDLDGGEAVFDRALLVESVRVRGDAEFGDAEVRAGLSMSDAEVDGDVVLEMEGGAAGLSRVKIGGDLSLFVGRFDGVTLDEVKVLGDTDFDDAVIRGDLVIRDSDLGQDFSADDARFEGDCLFRNAVFPGDDPMAGAFFARSPTLIETHLPLPSAAIAGDEEGEDDE